MQSFEYQLFAYMVVGLWFVGAGAVVGMVELVGRKVFGKSLLNSFIAWANRN